MIEKGKIIEIKGNYAVVLMEEKERCKGCGLCKKILHRQPILEVENNVNAKVGDSVEVLIDEDFLLKMSIYIYGLPLLGFLLGIFISYFMEGILKILLFLSLFISFSIYGFKKGKKISEKVRPKIIKSNET